MSDVEALQQVVEALEAKMKLMELQQCAPQSPKTPDVIDPMEVMAVSLKLPAFYEDRPETWFYFAESQFRLRRIKDDQTKFDHIWQSLSAAQSARVESVMYNPPPVGQRTETLKAKILQIFGRTQYEKDNDLLSHGPLGDMTVLEFVGKMQTLNKDPATFMRAFLLNKLPADVRGMLSNSSFASLEELAIAADNIIKSQKAQPQKTAYVVEECEVDAVARTKPAGTKPKLGKTGGKTRLAPGQKGTCFYHDKHGPGAFKCEGGGCVWAHIPLAAPPAGNGSAGR